MTFGLTVWVARSRQRLGSSVCWSALAPGKSSVEWLLEREPHVSGWGRDGTVSQADAVHAICASPRGDGAGALDEKNASKIQGLQSHHQESGLNMVFSGTLAAHRIVGVVDDAQHVGGFSGHAGHLADRLQERKRQQRKCTRRTSLVVKNQQGCGY